MGLDHASAMVALLRIAILSLAAALILPTASAETPVSDVDDSARSALDSIHMVTIAAADPAASARRYQRYFGYTEVERGEVPAVLAKAWGATNASERLYILLKARGPDLAYLRFVASEKPPDFEPLTSRGWTTLELLVRDPYRLHESLAEGPFEHLAGPAPLLAGSSIHAVQYLGPDGEVLYLTADLGTATGSTLARARAAVERPFIVVLAGATEQTQVFYETAFGLQSGLNLSLPIPFIARAQNIDTSHNYPLALLRLNAFSHSLEIDTYPRDTARLTLADELPPGMAIVTFCGHDARWSDTTQEMTVTGAAYGGLPVRVMRGAADEIIEVVDCRLLPSEETRER